MLKPMERLFLSLILFFFCCCSTATFAAGAANDTAVLALFRSQTDPHATLLSNWTLTTFNATACSANWLRLLDLRNNRLNGSLAPISQCLNLKLIYLSGNDFSGSIPEKISNLSRLLTLRLQNNELSGIIPASLNSLQYLTELNLSNNELYGIVPQSLYKRFGGNSFAGNEGLCGSPQLRCSHAGRPLNSSSSQTVPSNPSSLPSTPTAAIEDPRKKPRKGLGRGAIVAIVVANSVALLVIASFVVAFYCGKYSRETRLVFFDRRKQFELEELLRASAEMLGKGSLGTVYKAALDDGRTVAVKRLKDANPCARKEFEQYMDVIGRLKHPNIVKLRAYYYAKEEKLLVYDYLPNGSLHSLLHANRGPGRIPLDWTTRIGLVLGAARGLAHIHEEYEESRIPHGNLKSSNVLLDKNGVASISDFGLSLLLNPVHAIARLGGYKAPEQAEIKRLSQKADVYSFGVLLLEVLTGRAPSQYPSPTRPRVAVEEEELAVDLPKWVRSVVRDEWTAEVFDQELLRYKNIEEELVSMLHIALACVVQQPEKRPAMAEVAKLIEEIRVVQSPLGEDYDESRNSISPSLATTEDGMA
nr:leucine-rich repeat receptor-like protein kinase PXC1 [Ipomoea batatas]